MNSEIYLRCSMQDYYVKFCESRVARNDLEKLIDKSATLETEIRDGEWDNCSGTPGSLQSRFGKYMIVLGVVAPKGD